MDEDAPQFQLCGLRFSMYSASEISKLSVKEVTNPQTFDALMQPTYGGLHDPAFGPTSRDDLCTTCGQNSMFCPGHLGHIKLPLPVYNPVLFKDMIKLLRGTCFTCHRLRMPGHKKHLLQGRLRLLEYGQLDSLSKLQALYDEYMGEKSTTNSAEDTAVNIEELVDLLEDCITNVIQGLDTEKAQLSGRVKNIQALRQGLVKEFVGGAFFSKTKCGHCKTPLRILRTEHSTKVFFYKPQTKKATMAKDAKRKKEQERQALNPEEAEEVVMETEENAEKDQNSEKSSGQHTYLTPQDVQSHLRQVWEHDGDLLQQLFSTFRTARAADDECPTDVFFLTMLPVPPSRFRPVSTMGDKRFENPQSANLEKVLTSKLTIQSILWEISNKKQASLTAEGQTGEEQSQDTVSTQTLTEKLQVTWLQMQVHANRVFDCDLDKLGTEKLPGIKQLLEKKEGLFRKHMMGKRVNYACRSVISPDPYIATNEIGIPMVFALRLTYPQPVTPWNFHELKQAVINGPNIYPGATHIIHEDGFKVILSQDNATQREAMAKQLLTPSHKRGLVGCKKVYRHLKHGDVLLLNRQPTLHRPSIQAHKARILPGEKTLRMHYANCKAYNADFDGDEMNAHFPQDEISRAEAYTIASTDVNYLVPKDGSPLAGLIQDHMVSGVNLMIRGRFFTRADYQQLVFCALTDKTGPIKLLPPAFIKPQCLWSGKQVLSSVLLNVIPEGKPPLNLTGRAKVSIKNWVNGKPRAWIGGHMLQGDNMSESEVVIRQGELLVGVLDKGHYGNTPYSLVHCCYELYGGEVAGKLLTCFAKLFTTFLQYRGFTLGVEDILCTEKADNLRTKVMKASATCGPQVAAKAFNVQDANDIATTEAKMAEAHFDRNSNAMQDLDLCMKGQTDEIQNEIVKVIMPQGLLKKFPHNNLQLMVQSGAKGSSVNCMQISCLLGQIELEGHRPPLMLNGRSLPSFQPFEMEPRAGGFIDGRFLTGIRPQEYFFHCMAGREGLVDTAVKTSRSGYLQRCIIKHLEGLTVNYDMTVRDSDGSIVQFQYGEDGLEIGKTPFLKEKQFPFLVSNHSIVATEQQLNSVKSHLDTERAPALWKKFKKWKKHHPDGDQKEHFSAFLRFCSKKWKTVKHLAQDNDMEAPNKALVDMWKTMDSEAKEKYGKHTSPCPDPVNVQVNPVAHLGAVSERMESLINSYLDSQPPGIVGPDHTDVGAVSSDHFRDLMYMRNVEALVQPGEAVGTIAAQSIGEPSTQMTLNTFHFAGRGEMNVTLGIPRLREILMVASANIKTPSMDVPLLDTAEAHDKAKEIKLKFTQVRLSQVVEEISVTESIAIQENNNCRRYKIRLEFLPHEMYKEELNVTPSEILNLVEKKFFINVVHATNKRYRDIATSSLLNTAFIRTRAARRMEPVAADEDVSDDEQHDGDATATKQRERQMEDLDYQGEDEERVEVGDEEEEEEEDEGIDVMEEAEEGSESSSPEGSRSNSPVPTPKSKKRKRKKMSEKRINDVLHNISVAKQYVYDADDELWCELTMEFPLRFQNKLDMTSLIEEEVRKMILYQTPGIKRCFLSESKVPGEEGMLRIKTEGINLEVMPQYDRVLDLNKLYTNDIHRVVTFYGIEAAVQVIIKEIRNVFAAYGIDVDYRHLSLVADYMTFEGSFKPFSRIGMESNVSALQKMTFETTMAFLKEATMAGAREDLNSPSSRLVVGQLVKGGTGSFDIVQKIV